jgi:hypothetical protein
MAEKYGSKGETYSVNQRVRGGAYVNRLNPAIVSSHIDADIGAKHLPMPMVRSTFQRRSVPEQDANRKSRIEIRAPWFK